MKVQSLITLFVGAGISLTSSSAFAHPGVPHSEGLLSGFAHPFTGIDHLLTMLAVGLLASRINPLALNAPRSWRLPASFMLSMAIGCMLPLAGHSLHLHLPLNVEPLVLASMIIMGVLVANPLRLPATLLASLVGFFGFCHGLAHGLEQPTGANGGLFLMGALLATGLLHSSGLFVASWVRQALVRAAGAAIAAAGLLLASV